MTAPLGKLADRPAPQADSPPDDLLSELLRSVRLSGERMAEYTPGPTFSIGFAEVGSLHLIEEGELDLRIDGRSGVDRVGRGDMVLIPRGDSHRLSDVEASGPVRWLHGTFTIGDPQASHLLRSLPDLIVLGGAGTPVPEGLEVARRMLLIEMLSPSQGSAVMIARILDLMFIQIMRTWAAGTDVEPNWLAGAFDPQLGPSLQAIHRDLARDWTVDELAQLCNLSRSAFAARFAARVGKPPATYLAQVRLDSATDLLRGTALTIPHIAERVGYTSEAAFSRAFKSRYGTPPARWRRDLLGRG
ncbi:AraC family transcriptional regulator [Nocardia sp. CDC153]|uniref:AraC family transcriptional regulator n=1 Tax=Nocardia sp. CDC153 TaxID=3112167 RepID=UPI002DBABC79|nr:AraC family transcriptional regulator [Nocardia sp. CDC153]MEC3954520.1 AraC family transcriptional regulator [Nocardia sp. CDC153]